MCAANNGHGDLCQKLVLAGADVNIKDKVIFQLIINLDIKLSI